MSKKEKIQRKLFSIEMMEKIKVEEGDRTKYSFFLEEKVSGKTELFQREKGSTL